MEEFKAFPKIPRLSRDMVITEMIDGTNAQITIWENIKHENGVSTVYPNIRAGSRNRYLTPENDNHGFAAWVQANKEELFKLGPGTHYGEWWGQGIQRGYGLKIRKFSLFNVGRWNKDNIPACCDVVPVLYEGPFDTEEIRYALHDLKSEGSYAAPGYMNPEGIIIFHKAGGYLFKKTFEKDDTGKEAAGELPMAA